MWEYAEYIVDLLKKVCCHGECVMNCFEMKSHSRKKRNPLLSYRERGSLLIEGVIALGVLVFISIALIKMNVHIYNARKTAVIHNMAEAYTTIIRSKALGIPFNAIETDSMWSLAGKTSTVSIGIFAGKRSQTAALKTILVPKAYTPKNTNTQLGFNVKIWELKSHLIYKINGRDYVRTTSIIRSFQN